MKDLPKTATSVVSAMCVIALGLLAGCVTNSANVGDEPGAGSGDPTYANDIAPLLKQKCVACHGTLVAQKGLRLKKRDQVLAGGESGPAVVPGAPQRSPLYTSLLLPADDPRHMPPLTSEQTVSATEKEMLRRWIASGAR